MTRVELPARAANILRAIESRATCDSTVVESLKLLLLPTGPTTQRESAIVGSARSKVKEPAAARPKAANPRAKKQPAVVVHECVENERQDTLKSQETLLLATEVVNVTLKALTIAVKTARVPQTPKSKRRSLAKSSLSASKPGFGTTPRCQTPLQPTNVNRIVQSPVEVKNFRRSLSGSLQDSNGVRAQAECARIGLACLRSLQVTNFRGAKFAPLQLETGMSALVAKLLALGYDDLALKELRILRRRIETIASGRSGGGVKGSRNAIREFGEQDADHPKDALPDLLKYTATGLTGSLLGLVITSQIQALKILAIKGHGPSSEAVLKHLRIEVEYAPFNLVERQIDPKIPNTRINAVHQLQSLAQAMFRLCHNASKATAEPSKSRSTPSAETTLALQSLAFQIQLRSWALSEHQPNTETEVIGPFARHLGAFQRRCKLESSEKYNVAKCTFKEVTAALGSLSTPCQYNSTAVLEILADLASAASCDDEAIQWIETGLESKDAIEGFPLQRSAFLCRLATYCLRDRRNRLNDNKLLRSLRDAIVCLESDLRGEFAELDALLVAVTDLRKTAFLFVQENSTTFCPSEILLETSCLGRCTKVILLSLQFLARYVGREPSHDATESKVLRYKQRRHLANQTLPSTIASVIAVSKLSVKSEEEVWREFDSGLQDCLELYGGLGVGAVPIEKSQQTADRSLPIHVTVSQIYWLRFLALRSMGVEAKALVCCLKRSIEMLGNCKSEEKAKGCLPMKLEKHAFLCEILQDYKGAAKSYEQVVRLSIDDGGIQRLVEAATSTPLPSAVAQTREFEQISRALHALPKVMSRTRARASEPRIFFDAEWLPTDQRGLVLQMQLYSVIALLTERDTSFVDGEELHALSLLLLSLYDEHNFPIHRLYVCVQLLQLSIVHPTMVEHSLVCKTLEGLDQQLPSVLRFHGGPLQSYLVHLVSRAHVCLNIRGAVESPYSRPLERIIADWCRLLQECSNRQVLEERVYDVFGWLQQLDLISVYLRLSGLETLRTAVLHLLVAVHEGASSTQCLDLASNLIDLGIHYARLGYTGLSGVTLQKARHFLDVSDVPMQLKVKCSLANTEYALLSGNLDKCCLFLEQARALSQINLQSIRQSEKDRKIFMQSTADFLLIHSRLAAEKGDPGEALYFARASVQDYQRMWALLERRLASRRIQNPVTNAEKTLVDLVSEVSMSESQANSTFQSRCSALGSSAFWHLTPRLFTGFLHLSRCFAHSGLLLEAQHYLDQCQKVADAVQSPFMIRTCLTLRGQYAICSSDVEQGLTMLREVEKSLDELPSDYNNVNLTNAVAELYMKAGQIEAGNATCNESKRRLRHLMMKSAPDRLLFKLVETQDLELQMSGLKLGTSPQALNKKIKGARRKAPTKSSVKPRAAGFQEAENFLPPDVIPLNNLKGDMLRNSTTVSLSQCELDTAANLLEDASALQQRQQDVIMQGLLCSQANLRQGLQQLVGDPVFSILPESTLCCPAVIMTSESEKLSKSPSKESQSAKIVPGKTSSKKLLPRDKATSNNHSRHLPLAQHCLSEVFNLAKLSSSTSTVHTITGTMSKILTMLSALPNTHSMGFCSSQFMAYTLELGKQVAMDRESMSIDVEYQLSEKRDPSHLLEYKRHYDGIKKDPTQLDEPFGFSNFQEEYINIIPKSWTVLSMTLSESCEEIWISKIRAGQSPFILRLPFNRENTPESDEESFTFHEGRSEILEIVRLANISAHSASDLSRKGAKTEWWETRATLDTRLKDLLINIENIWFGGFRSIFSPNLPEPSLLARFQQSLQNILDKHLPSRQTSAKGKHISRVRLDPRVLELFVGLGPPSTENDVEEQLTDLLYFVVDILQFHEERNAYDEIDFDAIVVETADALRQYHQAVSTTEAGPEKQHTILVLDRNLHCFPWESLPCMTGHSVSRVPSLGCLRRRILQMQEAKAERSLLEPLDGVFANASHGAYILNPGGDLVNTQSTFAEPLRGLSTWDSFVEQKPSETDMKGCLQDHNLFLYFGHGSGGQYIRSRTIKKLEQCAVSLLMGCSSGALTQAGEFEAYGTPMNYMHAGCPALVATLWDVTDKDIDRFSDQLLRTWGLFKDTASALRNSPVKKSAKLKGKMKAKEKELVNETGDTKVSLDEAVAKSRDSCILRYLNGAAPIVYGIPVFLS